MNYQPIPKIKLSAAEITFCIFIALASFIANWFSNGPIIHADEISYFTNAAAIYGYKNDLASSYHSGYSILISPAFWFFTSPQHIWIVIKVLNTLLFLGFLLLATIFIKTLSPRTIKSEIIVYITLLALYPVWFVGVGYSMAHIAFYPCYLFIVLLFYHFHKSPTLINGGYLGLVSSFLYWIHPTAAPALFALVLVSVYSSAIHRKYLPFCIFVLVLVITCCIYTYFFTPWLHSQMNIGGHSPRLHYPEVSGFFSNMTTFSWWSIWVGRAGGQLTYLLMGSAGIALLGFFLTIKQIFTTSFDDTKTLTFIFILLTLILTFGMSTVFMSNGTRLDHWIYGRYTEGVLAPLLILGLINSNRKAALWAIPLIIISSSLWWLMMNNHYVGLSPMHVSAFWQLQVILDWGVYWWVFIGIFIIILIAYLPRTMSNILLASVFLTCITVQIQYHQHELQHVEKRWQNAKKVRELFPAQSCVGFEFGNEMNRTKANYWLDANYILYDYNLMEISFQKWLKHCDGPLFSYNKKLFYKKNLYLLSPSRLNSPPLWSLTPSTAP